MKKTAGVVWVLFLVLLLAGCGGLRYSQVAPDAKDFHPQRIGVLPVETGPYEEARGTADSVIAAVLVNKKWFADVVAAESINRQIQSNDELRKVVLEYLTKLRTVNFSDPALSRRIGELCRVDAFLVVNVDYWNYTTEGEKKIGKVGLGVKMVEASTGKIMWKAGHHEASRYYLIKPDLKDVAESLFKTMIGEMPH
ncbi:MAG: hypothetical protein HPY65_14030 [Syntrophaceae bacterium]|nr:hypothetical protein [Syntrophaceae bacterium]